MTTSHYFPQQLRHAIEKGSIPEMQAIQVKDWNQPDGSGSTPLAMACRLDHLHIVEFLLETHNVQLHVCDVCQKTPLHVASEQGHAAIVACLLRAGASPDLCNSSGESPIVAACAKGHLSVVELLLQQASDEQTKKGLFAACFSWKTGCIHIVQYILEQHPPQTLINRTDRFGRTPLLQVLRAWKYAKQTTVLTEKTELMEYLITKGATVDDDTFLYAASSGNESAVYVMIRHHPELWQPLRRLLGNPFSGITQNRTRNDSPDSSRWSAILKKDSFDMSPSCQRRTGRRRPAVEPSAL